MKETKKTNSVNIAGVGQKLFAHSKLAELTARRGLVPPRAPDLEQQDRIPKTPLYDRLKAAGRIVCDDHRDSNIQFLQPYEQG